MLINPDDLWPATRNLHFQGGQRAVCDHSGRVTGLFSDRAQPIVVDCTSYQGTYSQLQKLGLRIVGVDYFQSRKDIDDFTPSVWKAFAELGDGTTAPCGHQSEMWSNIAYHAHASNLQLSDISRRISHQLRVVEWRLRQVSDHYRILLTKTVREKDFEIGGRFSSERTWLAFLAIQTFLVDACVLRDYFAEFVAWRLYADGTQEAKSVRQMGKLKKLLQTSGLDAPFLAALRDSIADNAWLTELGAYRDLVVHAAPLEHADRSLYAKTQEVFTALGTNIVCLRLPLPKDPKDTADRRSKGEHLSSPGFGTFGYSVTDDRDHPDGIDYAHLVTIRLAWLSQHLVLASPIKPEGIVFSI